MIQIFETLQEAVCRLTLDVQTRYVAASAVTDRHTHRHTDTQTDTHTDTQIHRHIHTMTTVTLTHVLRLNEALSCKNLSALNNQLPKYMKHSIV